MAYLAFSEVPGDAAYALAPVMAPEPRRPGFSALEWSVVAVAERDSLSTLRSPGRMAVALGALFGGKPDTQLADSRLEALRRMAVLTWHQGYRVAESAIHAFLAAGFTLDHYELLAGSITSARAKRRLRSRN
jgi:hypothetical protein